MQTLAVMVKNTWWCTGLMHRQTSALKTRAKSVAYVTKAVLCNPTSPLCLWGSLIQYTAFKNLQLFLAAYDHPNMRWKRICFLEGQRPTCPSEAAWQEYTPCLHHGHLQLTCIHMFLLLFSSLARLPQRGKGKSSAGKCQAMQLCRVKVGAIISSPLGAPKQSLPRCCCLPQHLQHWGLT